MRKIASNYIFLPGYPLVKNGYVILDGCRVVDVIDTGGIVKEIQGLEFYGGLLVDGLLRGHLKFHPGKELLPEIELLYRSKKSGGGGLAIIKGADLNKFLCLPGTLIERLI